VLKQVEAGVLRVAYEETGGPTGSPVLLLHGFSLRCARLRRSDAPPRSSRLSRHHAVLARLWSHTFCVPGHASFRPAGRVGAGSARPPGRARDRPGGTRRVRLGRPGGLYRRGAVARPGPGARVGRRQRLQHSGHCRRRQTPSARDGTAALVPILFSHRARPAGLAQNRHALCKLLWQLWSPNWRFDDATYEQTAVSFDNPDFVEVVIHSYRHRYGVVPGDPAVEDLERQLAPSRASRCRPSRCMARRTGCSRRVGPSSSADSVPGPTSTA